MTDSIRVNSVQINNDPQGQPASTPGELVANQGPGGVPEWSFMGNGQISAADVMSRILEVDSGDDASIKPFVGNRDAAIFSARRYLMTQNRHLAQQDPEQPIAQGEQFFATTGPSLKEMLAPFAKNLDALRQAVADSNVGLSAKENKMTGNVAARGRGLPIDPTI